MTKRKITINDMMKQLKKAELFLEAVQELKEKMNEANEEKQDQE